MELVYEECHHPSMNKSDMLTYDEAIANGLAVVVLLFSNWLSNQDQLPTKYDLHIRPVLNILTFFM